MVRYYTYKDPLLLQNYLGMQQPSHVWNVLEADGYLHKYIWGLNHLVFNPPPPGVDEKLWHDLRLGDLCSQIATRVRLPWGWCIVKFYKDGTYRLFSERERHGPWILTDDINSGSNVVLGCKVNYSLIHGRTVEDEVLLFADPAVYLFRWMMPIKNSEFACGDLNIGLWTVFTTFRQTRGQIATIGALPGFKLITTGPGINSTQARQVEKILEQVSTDIGIAAPLSEIVDIKTVVNESIGALPIVEESQLRAIAATTGLPLSFWSSERLAGGLGGGGAETADEIRVELKKKSIFEKLAPELEPLLREQYGINVTLRYEPQFDSERFGLVNPEDKENTEVKEDE